jgi:hypothetical protein
MILSSLVERAIGQAPLAVMAYAALEHALEPTAIDELFQQHAQTQYTRKLLLSDLVSLMADVVCRSQPSVRQAYTANPPDASLTAVYAKLTRVEPHLARQLVLHTAHRLRVVIDQLRPTRDAWFPGHEVRILDGNILKGSHHRLQVLRPTRASALAGVSITVLDPERGLAVDWFGHENGHAQERSLLPEVLETVQPGQVWIGDRNFCTTDFLGGILARQSRFLIRQHASTVRCEEVKPLRLAGRTKTGRVWVQWVRLTNVAGQPRVRRVVVRLDQPTEDGDDEIHLLTNVPVKVASACQIAEGYLRRWGIEALFQRLTVVLNAEVRPLGYPRAALFGFATALVASNALAVVKEALAAAHPDEDVGDQLSHFALGLELRQSKTLLELVAEDVGAELRALSVAAFVCWLRSVAAAVKWTRYRKTGRGPKKPRPERPKCPRYRHVATKKLLDQRRE